MSLFVDSVDVKILSDSLVLYGKEYLMRVDLLDEHKNCRKRK